MLIRGRGTGHIRNKAGLFLLFLIFKKFLGVREV